MTQLDLPQNIKLSVTNWRVTKTMFQYFHFQFSSLSLRLFASLPFAFLHVEPPKTRLQGGVGEFDRGEFCRIPTSKPCNQERQEETIPKALINLVSLLKKNTPFFLDKIPNHACFYFLVGSVHALLQFILFISACSPALKQI